MVKIVKARIAGGRVFHNRGDELHKDLSPKIRNRLSGTFSNDESLDHSDGIGRYQDKRSVRYWGAKPSSALYVSSSTLKATLCPTGSQCSPRMTGVMWSRRPVRVTRRAAAFCTHCSLDRSVSGRPKNNALPLSEREVTLAWTRFAAVLLPSRRRVLLMLR